MNKLLYLFLFLFYGLWGQNLQPTINKFQRSNSLENAQCSLFTKYIDDNISQAQQAENDWIVIRYADIVLQYAEILAQDGGYTTAHVPVNLIRERAGVAPMAAFTSVEMALDSVYHERKLELAFENHRWYDLLRMQDSYNNEEKPMEILREHTFVTDVELYSSFNPLPPPDPSNYTVEHLLLPIPQVEIDTNNEMDIPQNPGY